MTNQHRDFLLLRASGKSFDYIAKELKIAKTTAIQWAYKHKKELQAIEFETFVDLKETYKANTKERYQTALLQLQKIDKAILDIDLKQANIKDLLIAKKELIENISTIERQTKMLDLLQNENIDTVLRDMNLSYIKLNEI